MNTVFLGQFDQISAEKCDPRLSPNRKIGPSLLTTEGRKRSTNHLLNVKE